MNVWIGNHGYLMCKYGLIHRLGLFEDPLSASIVYQIVRGEIIEHEESY